MTEEETSWGRRHIKQANQLHEWLVEADKETRQTQGRETYDPATKKVSRHIL